MTAATAGKRRRRFAERRLDSLRDEPRPGAPRRDDDLADVIRRTRNAAGCHPLEPALHVQGGGPSTPNPESLLPETSPQRDLQAVKRSVVRREGAGGHCTSTRRAPALSVDEKSQMQALDRTQPLLAPRSGWR